MLPTPRLDLRASMGLTEEYSDNFNREARNARDNFRTALAPGGLLLINTGLLTGSVGYNPSVMHDSSTDTVSLFHALAGQLSWQATPRLRLTFTDVFAHSDDPDQADRLNLRQGRGTFTRNNVSLTSDYQPDIVRTQQFYRLATFFADDSDTVSQTLGVSASATVYQSNTVRFGYEYLTSTTTTTTDEQDTRGHQVTASLSRRLGEFTSAGLSTGYVARTTEAELTSTDFSIWNASLFGSYAGPDLTVSGSIGWSQLDSTVGSADSSISTAATVSYRFARGTAALQLERGFSETFAEGENAGVVETEGASLAFSYPFTPAITGTTTAFYRKNNLTGLAGGQVGRTDENWGGSLGGSVRLRPWLSLAVTYQYRKTISSTRETGFEENRIQLSLRAAFE